MHEFDVISIWPDWEIVDLLGKGKYGEVYYARKVESDEVFYSAIKVINLPYHTQLADKAVSLGMKQEHLWEYFRKFKNDLNWELTVSKMFNSPHILPIEDVRIRENLDAIGWQVFVRTGIFNTLDDFLEEHPAGRETAIRLGLDMLKALSMCDSSGSVHGEIKPSNILVSDDGSFMLRDFGIRRCLEKAGAALFGEDDRIFDAPEVRSSGEYSVASDLYSLGLVLHYVRNGGTMPETAAEQEDAEFSAILQKAVAENPHDRYQTASEFTAALEGLLVVRTGNMPPMTEEEAEFLEEELQEAEEAAEEPEEEIVLDELPEELSLEKEEESVPQEAELDLEEVQAPETAEIQAEERVQTALDEMLAEPESAEEEERLPSLSEELEPTAAAEADKHAAAENEEGSQAPQEPADIDPAQPAEKPAAQEDDIEKMVRLDLLEESMFAKDSSPEERAAEEDTSVQPAGETEKEEDGEPAEEKGAKKRGKRRGVLIVLLILVLAAAAVAVYYTKPWTYLNLGGEGNGLPQGQSAAVAAGIANELLAGADGDVMVFADSADIAVPKMTAYIPENVPPAPLEEEEELADPYILPTDTEQITPEDLAGMSRSETYMVINEIYARHGKIFNTASIQEYFEAQSWYERYSKNSGDIVPLFNETERANVGTVTSYQREMGYR